MQGRRLQNAAAGSLPEMATKGTKTPIERNEIKKIRFVTFVLFVVREHFSPGRTRY